LSTLPPQLRIANTAAVLDGPYGTVSRQARTCGLSRQALYRDAPKVVQAVDGSDARHRLQALQEEIHRLHATCATLRSQQLQAVRIDADRLAAFASTAQAEGVSLPVARRLLAALLAKPLAEETAGQPRLPSVARLGRMSRAAAERSAALLNVLDSLSRDRVEEAAADEIFFGPKPCLMVVEQHSLAWVSGRLAARRDGGEWAKELRQLPRLKQLARDGGSGLRKGLATVNEERQQDGQPGVADQEDHFHTLREGRRALRRMQGRVSRLMEKAEEAERRNQQQVRQGKSRQGIASVVAKRWRQAEQALDAWSQAEQAWRKIAAGIRLFTPCGELNTRPQAEAVIEAAVPALAGAEWSKAKRALARPELLTFLDQAREKVAAFAVPSDVREAAVQVESLHRQPEVGPEEGTRARIGRGLLLAAGLVLTLSGKVGEQALTQVRQVLNSVWRASSLVECINSVARMQQSRHRRMTQGLLDLKRLYWNCRAFRTGRRRKQTPYGLLGIRLPTEDWWELLKLTPEQLRQQLSASGVAA
jgi:hypothetical protein